ncbi:hypothetical protein JCM19000A_09310 [Silvimonas sp. JCM 19000]
MKARLLALTLVGAGALASPPGLAAPMPTTALAQSLLDDVALPAQRQLVEATRTLSQRVAELCNNPDADHLAAAQVAWRGTDRIWRGMETLRIGPNRQQDAVRQFEPWPLDETVLAQSIKRTPADPASPQAVFEAGTLPAGGNGLPALEYLLFSGKYKTAPALSKPQQCQYGRWVANGMTRRAQTLVLEWNTLRTGFNYNATLQTPYLIEALGNSVAGIKELGQRQLAQGRIDPAVTDLRGWRSSSGKANLEAGLNSIENTLLGAPSGLGFDDLLASRGDNATGPQLQEKIINVRLALAALPVGFEQDPGLWRGEMFSVQARLNELAAFLAGPFVDALGFPFKAAQ